MKRLLILTAALFSVSSFATDPAKSEVFDLDHSGHLLHAVSTDAAVAASFKDLLKMGNTLGEVTGERVVGNGASEVWTYTVRVRSCDRDQTHCLGGGELTVTAFTSEGGARLTDYTYTTTLKAIR